MGTSIILVLLAASRIQASQAAAIDTASIMESVLSDAKAKVDQQKNTLADKLVANSHTVLKKDVNLSDEQAKVDPQINTLGEKHSGSAGNDQKTSGALGSEQAKVDQEMDTLGDNLVASSNQAPKGSQNLTDEQTKIDQQMDTLGDGSVDSSDNASQESTKKDDAESSDSVSKLVDIHPVSSEGSEAVKTSSVQSDETDQKASSHSRGPIPVVMAAENSVELAKMLSQLYGDALDSFASDAKSDRGVVSVDCTAPSEDADFKVNIVTTLCPFLRSDGPCGQLRHPSYEAEDEKLFCSAECLPHIDSMMKALPRRHSLSQKHEASIFRAVSTSIISQYCVSCRSGCYLPV